MTSSPSLQRTKVRDAMRPGIVACQPDASLADVARTMARRRIHSVVVAANGDGGDLWAVVTDVDVLRVAHDRGDGRARELVARDAEMRTIDPDESLARAAELMAALGASHLIVASTRTGAPLGMLSSLDIARVLGEGSASDAGPAS
jgi:CBS domain-containing protein